MIHKKYLQKELFVGCSCSCVTLGSPWSGVTVGGYPPPAHAKDSPVAVSESLLAVERFTGDLETGTNAY